MANRPHVLDDVDYELLALVQEDWDRGSAELSEALAKRGHKLGGNACHNRIVALQESGHIKKRCAILNPAAKELGVSQICFMIVKIPVKSKENVEQFIEAASTNEAVVEVYSMLGLCDYLLKVRVKNLAEAEEISQVIGGTIAEIQTFGAGKTHKETTAVRIPRHDPATAVSGEVVAMSSKVRR